jgi:prolipoprotein diacylglyceryl transferase
VAWHSIFSFIALLVGSAVSFRCARWLVKDERIYPFALAVIFGGLVGARAFHVLDNPGDYADRPLEVFAFWGGGIAVIGAPLGSTISGYLAARALRLPVGFMFDITVIGIALGLAIGRLGDVVNGEHHAVACADLPWCVRYTHPATLGQSSSVHPVVAYDLLWALVIFVVLLLYWRRVRGRPPESRVYWLYLLLYGAGRALTSFLRLDPVVFAGLQEAHLVGAVYAACGAVMLVVLSRRERALAGLRARTPT